MRTKVELCGVDTSTLPVLKPDEMKDLFIRLQQGEYIVREQLVFCNLRLVLSIVGRYAYRGEQADDLFQVGCIGLLKAIDNFDLKHNVRFSTYAVPMIMGEIRRHLRDHHSLRVSRSLRDIAYKAMQAKERFIAEHLIEQMKKKDKDEWLKLCVMNDITHAPLLNMDEIYHSNYFESIPLTKFTMNDKTIPAIGLPFIYQETLIQEEQAPPVLKGFNTREVLQQLSFSEKEIDALVTEGIVYIPEEVKL